jgi:ATP-dependent DNA ligase
MIHVVSSSPAFRHSATPCRPALSVHEIKHDGYRFICRCEGHRVRVFSSRGNDCTERVPAIAEALRALPVTSVTLDGEGVVCDPDGRDGLRPAPRHTWP